MSTILEQHRTTFESDPSNRRAFDALEEHLFMSGLWNELIALYNRRLEAPEFANEPALAVPILFRLAQVSEERVLAVDRALETYWKVAKIDPTYRPALQQLRQIYTHREQWDMVLQIAEMEEQLEMLPHEKASFLAELGDVWNGKLNDPTEALTHYQNALALVADHAHALAGLAKVHEGLGHHEQAAAAWERLAGRMRGPDRAPILVSLGNILDKHLDQSGRAMECFQRALDDDPRCAGAVESLSATASHLEDWILVAKLYERRFDIASGAKKRVSLAVEAGRLNLDELNDTQAARMWLDRALEYGDGDASVYFAIAELERRTGNRDALRAALDHLIRFEGEEVSTSVLLEAADLYSEANDEEKAVALLRKAQVRDPENALVVETLSDGLAQLGLSAELVEVLERRAALIEDDPQSESEIHAEIGRIRLEDLDDREAGAASLVRAFELEPSTQGVASQLERLYRKDEDWSALCTLLERASCEGPSAKRSHYFASLGEIREQRFDDNEAAVSAYESALELDPTSQPAHQGLERIVYASGNEDDLLRLCEREAETTSDRARMAELVWKMLPLLDALERDEDALAWVEKLNQMCPDDRRTLQAIVDLREALGQRDELQEPMERLDRVLSGEDQTDNRRKLASLHRDAGRHQQSIEWYQTSLDGDPSHLESLRSLKALYVETRELEQLARTLRRLADALDGQERCDELGELASLLSDQIGDVGGAIVVLWGLARLPADQRPDDVDERLESLLERAGRFEELVQHLLQRRRLLEDDSDEAHNLDLRRAKLLLEDLGQYEEAAALYRSLRAGTSPDQESEEDSDEETGEDATADDGTLEGLEKALRLGNDTEGLVDLLAELAEQESDPMVRAGLEMERATLLEDALGAFDEALEALISLADRSDAPEIADQAGQHLERLLTRSGDWEALRARLKGRLGVGSQEDDLALHEELAHLSRDRFGERDVCIEHLEAAGKIAPDRQPIWHNLAVLYSELDRPEDLLRVLEHELTLDLDTEREIMLRSRAARLAKDLEGREESCGRHYEQILEFEPGHAEATEYLLEFYERECRPVDRVRLLHARLDATLAGEDSSETAISSSTSLRLRIADLESLALDDDVAAVATLLPAIDAVGPRGAVAKPLVELYLRLGRREEYTSLCQRAADHCDLPEERASWLLRLGDALREDDAADRAIGVYRQVLEACPESLDAEAALRELYRERGDSEPLAGLLARKVERLSDQDAIPTRLELATLLAGPLDQPVAALDAFNKILAASERHPEAFVYALHLNIEQERHQETQRLLQSGLGFAHEPIARAALLEQLADLEAGPLELPSSALGRYREALSLDPSRTSIRVSMSVILTELGRWVELLDCLFLEAQHADVAERSAIYERAIEIAIREVSHDAALPWLERLHAAKPEEPEVLSRIADIHRQAGRPEALLRALEAQLALTTTSSEVHRLQCDIGRVLERDLASPGRAVLALEAAHTRNANDPELLTDLDRLYDALGRFADRAGIIEERIGCSSTPGDLLSGLHRDAAELWHAKLSSPETATRHLLHSLDLCDADSTEVLPLTRQLQQSLRATGRLDGWARAAESELEQLNATGDPLHDERRFELRSELADCYEHVLARPQLAQRHLLALLGTWDGAEPLSADQIDAAEAALIHHLRREQNYVELELRLCARLDRTGGSAQDWLELAVLQKDRLHRPSAARRAYRHALEQQSDRLDAIRGLREVSETLRDWPSVAESLDLELALEYTDVGAGGACGDDTQDASTRARTAQESSALLCSLGEIAWKQLQADDSLERASRAYCANLDHMPGDLETVRALQQIEEERGEFQRAISRHRQEIEILAQLGEVDPEQGQRIWLRIAELTRDKTSEIDRAIEAFGSAAQFADLSVQRLREWAELYRTTENWERFADVFGSWCDARGTPAGCSDLLVLMDILIDLGHHDRALERAELAIEADRTRAGAFESAAALRERQGDIRAAADHLAEAAELTDAATASSHLLRASLMVANDDPERSASLLRRGADHDAASLEIQVRLALVCEQLELWDEAKAAAARALDSTSDASLLEDGLLLNAVLAGGRAAWQSGAIEAAIQLFFGARGLAPENTECLDALGELLDLRGDVRAARDVLKARLQMSDENPRQGQQLAIVGKAQELDEEYAAALETYQRAIEIDPSQDGVHDSIVRIHMIDEDPVAAIAALDNWIELLDDNARKAVQQWRAAQLDQSIEETESALSRLRTATDLDPTNAPAWTLLAELLHQLEQPDDALEAATSGLAVIDAEDHASVAILAYIRGCTLEQGGEKTEAAGAYGLAVENDTAQIDAVLAQSRLLQNTGDWQQAADVLGSFLELHPEPGSAILAQVSYKRGRLLAGPLERIEDAIACYEHAVALDPDFTQAIEPLAGLLSYMPERWEEAVSSHLALLRDDPTRESSIRSLITISEQRNDNRAQQNGLAILRALGATSEEEFEAAPDRLAFRVAEDSQLPDPHSERLRKMVVQARDEISQALRGFVPDRSEERREENSTDAATSELQQPAQQAFLDLVRDAIDELSVSEFESLDADVVGATIEMVAALALDETQPEIDPAIAEQLEGSVGRWARRRLRKSLEGTDRGAIENICWDDWLQALRATGAAVALDRRKGDLRCALLALSTDFEDAGAEELTESENIADRVRSREPAYSLLRQVMRVWCIQIGQ